MTTTDGFFSGWSARKKLGFALGLTAIVLLVAALAWWTQRAPKAVLFSDLADRDAAVIAAELDKLKLPYSVSEDGKSILVSADSVHRTRMAVMGKQLPLHGVVGFELFNNADFGVSDFVRLGGDGLDRLVGPDSADAALGGAGNDPVLSGGAGRDLPG